MSMFGVVPVDSLERKNNTVSGVKKVVLYAVLSWTVAISPDGKAWKGSLNEEPAERPGRQIVILPACPLVHENF